MAYTQVRTFKTTTIGALRGCLSYVRRGFGIPATGVLTAWASWQMSNTKHRNRNHPKNVDVAIYFSGAGGAGHVVVWKASKDKYYSSPYRFWQLRARFSNLADIERIYRCSVVGWTEGVNGYRVVKKVAEPTPVTKKYYTAKKGDTLGKIAKAKNTTVKKLMTLNPQLKNPDLIYPGQRIRIK